MKSFLLFGLKWSLLSVEALLVVTATSGIEDPKLNFQKQDYDTSNRRVFVSLFGSLALHLEQIYTARLIQSSIKEA